MEQGTASSWMNPNGKLMIMSALSKFGPDKLTDSETSNNNKSHSNPDSKVHGANMGPIWGQQDPGGPHVGPMNFAIWEWLFSFQSRDAPSINLQ